MSESFIEELISIKCGDLNLSGLLAYPESGAPKYAVLICPPHPNFAGNMENNVVVALAREFSPRAVTLRFDYRGIGASEFRLPEDLAVFDYWDEIEHSKNYADPLDDVVAAATALSEASRGLPLVIAGYSFGSIVGLTAGLKIESVRAMVGLAPPLAMFPFNFLSACDVPCLLLSGEDDFVFSSDECARLKSVWSKSVRQIVLAGQDHFFRDSDESVCASIRAFVERGFNL